MEQIKPCPFCGNKNVCVRGIGVKFVTCGLCLTFGPMVDTEAKAIERWNAAPRKEDVEMEQNCGNCKHISEEVEGKVYCLQTLDNGHNCKYWEPDNPLDDWVKICFRCKHAYATDSDEETEDKFVTRCGYAIGNPEGYVCDSWEAKEPESTPLNPSNSSGLDTADEIAAKTDLRANVAQLMEEAAELIAACSKYLRTCGSGQPTPVTVDEALAMIGEEAADVHLVTEVIIRQSEAVDDIFTETANRKILRWKGRLENDRQR